MSRRSASTQIRAFENSGPLVNSRQFDRVHHSECEGVAAHTRLQFTKWVKVR